METKQRDITKQKQTYIEQIAVNSGKRKQWEQNRGGGLTDTNYCV